MTTKHIILYIIFLVFSIALIGCTIRYQPAPIETPGAIYQVTTKGDLPLPLEDWQYNDDWLLLAGGLYPWEAVAALYNWSTGELKPLNITDLGYEPKSQGPNDSIAYTRYPDNMVIVFDTEDQSTFPVAKGFVPSFSSDGEFIAMVYNRKLIAVNLTDLSEKVIWDSKNKERGTLSIPNWIPESTLIAFSYEVSQSSSEDQGESILVVDSTTGNSFILVEDEKIADMAISPDGRLLVYIFINTSSDRELRIMDIRNQCLVGSLEVAWIDKVEWSPKGDKLAVIYWENLYFIDIKEVFGAPYEKLSCP
jgi:WD40 repeat protein